MLHTFVDEGHGAVVLLLHGAIPDGRYFAPLVRALRDDHRVLVPTSPGYGGSAPAKSQLSMAQHVEALIDDLVELGVSSLCVAGSSAGGYRALALALSKRVRATSVFLLAGFAELPAEHRASLRQFASALRAGADVAPVAAPTMFAPWFAASRPDEVASIVAQLREVPAATLAAELEAAAECEDLTDRLGELRAPLSLRVGDADLAVPKERSEVIAGAVPHATLQIVHGAGHSLLVEDADATIAAVVRAFTTSRAVA